MQPYATGCNWQMQLHPKMQLATATVCNWQMQLTQTRLRGRSRVVVTLLHRIFCKPLLTHPKQLLPLLRHARFSIHPTPLLNLRPSQKVLCCDALKFLSMLLTTLTLCIKFFWTTNLSTAPAHPLRTIDIVTTPKCITHLSNL